MKKLSDATVKKDWNDLTSRHRVERARAIARYAIGRNAVEVSKLVEMNHDTVLGLLRLYGLCTGVHGELSPRSSEEWTDVASRQKVRTLLSKHRDVTTADIDQWKLAGYTDPIAKSLATAEAAGQSAVKSGDIKIENGKMALHENIVVPWETKIKSECYRVWAVAKFLDGAKISDLRKKSTLEAVSKAHAKWLEQIDRISNFHPSFDEKVEA